MSLSEVQVNDLARPLVGIITKFYADPMLIDLELEDLITE